MGARVKKIRHDEDTRAKIKASQIVNRLQSFIEGEIEMVPHQVSAALGLLRKTLPDLNSINHEGTVGVIGLADILAESSRIYNEREPIPGRRETIRH